MRFRRWESINSIRKTSDKAKRFTRGSMEIVDLKNGFVQLTLTDEKGKKDAAVQVPWSGLEKLVMAMDEATEDENEDV